MKKTFITMALACLASVGMAQQKCLITGHLDGISSDSLYVLVIDENFTRQERIDTVLLQNGDINYSIACNQMRSLLFVPAQGDVNSSLRAGYMSVLAMPGEKAVISGTPKEYFFSGSKFYEEFNEYDRLSSPINAQMNDVRAEYQQRMEAKENTDSVQKQITAKFTALQKELIDVDKNFIKTHPTSHVSGYLLASIPREERATYKALLTDEVINGPTAPCLKSIEKREAAEQARKEAAKSIQPSMDAPAFTLNDINGKPLALSSLRGKYVVLDFWGSWCGWCIKGMPKMKEYYEKYKGKFEIVGIDCNDTQEKWKAAVEKHQLPWLHVYNSKDDNVNVTYAIEGYPTKILIDPQGKINKVIVGEDPAFYTYLDELFGK